MTPGLDRSAEWRAFVVLHDHARSRLLPYFTAGLRQRAQLARDAVEAAAGSEEWSALDSAARERVTARVKLWLDQQVEGLEMARYFTRPARKS